MRKETHSTGGSVQPFKLYGCWCVCSLLVQPPLSHLLLLISMETGPGAFSHIHTLAINQQVRPGSIPTHTHYTDENKDHTHTHTQTQSLITEISQSTLYWISTTPLVLVDQTWQPYFLSIKATYSDVSVVCFFFTLGDDCSLVAPSPNTRRLVPISCSLFFLHGMNRKVLLCEFVI